jgi:hypothetical protein
MTNRFYQSLIWLTVTYCIAIKADAGELGVYLTDYQGGQGARVTQTKNNSPADRMVCPDCRNFHRLTSANVITAINGQRVKDASDAKRLLEASPTEAEITVLNIERGTERTYRTRLTSAIASKGKNKNHGKDNSSSQSDWNIWSSPNTSSPSNSDSFNAGAFRQQMDWNNFNRNYSRNPDHAPIGR